MTVRIRTRGGKLVIDIRTRSPDGENVRERRNAPDGIRTEKAARRWAESRQSYLMANGVQEEVVPASLFRDFAERWQRDYVQAEKLKPSTADAYERILRLHLTPVLGELRLDVIGEMEIQRVKLHVAKKSDKTRACVLSLLANLLGAAERWEEIARAPRFDAPKWQNPEMSFYDFEEWEALIDGARRAGPMVQAAMLLGGDAGLRRGELVALEQADVVRGCVHVMRNAWMDTIGTPKGGKSRRIPLTARLAAAIEEVRHLRGKRLLWQASGKPVGVPTLQSWMEVATKRAGLPPSRNLHKLRHTFCSHLAMRGAPAKVIQELAGHADLKTTLRYMHLSRGSAEDAIASLERGASSGAGGEQRVREGRS